MLNYSHIPQILFLRSGIIKFRGGQPNFFKLKIFVYFLKIFLKANAVIKNISK